MRSIKDMPAVPSRIHLVSAEVPDVAAPTGMKLVHHASPKHRPNMHDNGLTFVTASTEDYYNIRRGGAQEKKETIDREYEHKRALARAERKHRAPVPKTPRAYKSHLIQTVDTLQFEARQRQADR